MSVSGLYTRTMKRQNLRISSGLSWILVQSCVVTPRLWLTYTKRRLDHLGLD